MINDRKKNYLIWELLIIYLLFKFLTYYLQIFPIGDDIAVRVQLMHPKLLEEDLFRSIYYLHFQPPIWNLIYGTFIKIFGIDYNILGIAFHFFNIILSFFTIFYFYKISNFFKLTKIKIYIVYLFFFIFSVSFLYYETYIHYTHFTVFLFAQFSYLYLKFTQKQKLKYELLIYFTALFLGYTWSAFSIPLFMFVIFSGLTMIKFKQNILRSFILLSIFTILSISLSIKNKIHFNMFANSTWVGMQLYTVLSYDDNWDNFHKCNFNNVEEDEALFKANNPNFKNKHPSLTGSKSSLNNVGFITRSKNCLILGTNEILNDPIAFLKRVRFLFISSHGHFTSDHVGWDPKKWREYFSFVYDLNNNEYLNPIKVRALQLYYLLMYSFFILLTIKNFTQISSSHNRLNKSISSIFLIYIWLLLVIYLGAGYEHERMRHTGHFLHILFFIILFKSNFNYKNIVKQYFG